MKALFLAVCAVLLTGLVAAPLRAQGLCITCEQPNASYSCDVEAWDKVSKYRKSGQLAQLACITDIAQRYGHAECRVRTGVSGVCLGARHVVAIDGARKTDSEGAPITAQQPPDARPASPPSPNQPPRTVAEMAKNATRDTQTQIKNAGQAVTGAVGKTWRCLTSLFSDC